MSQRNSDELKTTVRLGSWALFPFVAALPACPAPGKGAVARSGYDACSPAINALAAYHADHGSYRLRLDELVPRYLARVPQATKGHRLFSIEYQLQPPDSYEIEFRYTGPGMNYCSYSSGPAAKWKCGGYY